MPRPPGASDTAAVGSGPAAGARPLLLPALLAALVALPPPLAAPAALPVLQLPALGSSAAPTEYEIKAAFLLNFARFVEWPPEALPRHSPLVFAVVGQDPFGSYLEETLRGESVQGHALEVKRFRTLEEIELPHVLFVAAPEDARLPRLLERLGDAPVLTVGESRGFAAGGGIIGFRLERRRVRFDVNIDAAQRSGLRLSSRLLRLARIVHDSPREVAP